jgi:hypothetical protein
LIITLGAIKCPKDRIEIDWDHLLPQIQAHRVQSAAVKGPEIVGVYTNGKTFHTTAPAPSENVKTLKAKDVVVTFQANSDQNAQECPKSGPVVLVDNAMNQHQARVQAAAIAVSVTGQTH